MSLFSSTTVGSLKLPNRVVLAPMTRCRADADHVPTAIMAEYYASRADAGLLITEGTGLTANGTGYPRIPGIYTTAQVEGWRRVTDAVHAAGGRIALQLMHTGRIGHALNLDEGAEVLAPSAVRAEGTMYTDQEGPQPLPTPRAMTGDEVEAAIEGYVQAARNAMEAGFDLVELHGANGYLIDQFLTPSTNLRTDVWGDRTLFAREVARRTAEAIGPDRVGIRLSPFGVFNDIRPWEGAAEDFVGLASRLGELGLAYLHLVDHSSMGAPALPEGVSERMKAAFGGPFVLVGGYDRDRADADLQAGRGDLVAFGRVYLANPDLVRRLREGAALNPPDLSTFYTPGPKGYTDYPTLE